MLLNFKAFLKATKDNFWKKVINSVMDAIDVVQSNWSSSTGLLPDFLEGEGSIETLKPARANFLESEFDGAYYYNAGRDP